MQVRDFITVENGGIAVMAGMMLGLLTLTVGGAIDLTQAATQKTNF